MLYSPSKITLQRITASIFATKNKTLISAPEKEKRKKVIKIFGVKENKVLILCALRLKDRGKWKGENKTGD